MMPGLDGLQLVAALRADPRTAGVPVLLLSARAGQEAAIEGLEAGADDYLVKPFAAAELLARVRANVELARLRTQHARWRAALLDSLHEAFFLFDEDGAVVEINAAFTDMLGYGPDGLPYPPRQPWWPDEQADPEGHRLASEALARLMTDSTGSFTVPLTPPRRAPGLGDGQLQRGHRPGKRPPHGGGHLPRRHGRALRRAAGGGAGRDGPDGVPGRAASPRCCRRRWANCTGCGGPGAVIAATWTGADRAAVTSTGPARSWADAARRAPRRARRAAGAARC